MLAARRAPFSSSRRNASASGSSRPSLLVRSVTAERASLDLSKKSAGGILLPSGPPKANSDAHFGEVLAVGEDVELKVSPGDFVVFNKYATAAVEVPEGEVVFVAEKSVIGTLE
ncbi:chaperonin [Raphidocelis subcapitata]|uniref:Chaperonin n=1 Tax=Raphidocelis subcapitata TaxID=307507 RepID=A0A2V0P028_9CHLO|nr:chaperonin [Raphidocelis subcapitata]|eukprot:GBF90435.1 chaperonin [Raphidocelis subcapitata]